MILPAKPTVFSAVAGLLILLSQLPVQSQGLPLRQELPEFQAASADTTPQVPFDCLLPVNEYNQSLTSVTENDVVKKEEVVCQQTIAPLRNNKMTKRLITSFNGKEKRFITIMLQRRHQYFPIYEQYLQQYGLPDELKYLSVIESNLNPRAKSPCRALGLWQFMPATGRQYQLYQDAYIDERLDPYKATEAACRYLKDLHHLFGNWELALAAYNCGPGNVRRAIRRSGNHTDFWQISPYLPRETRTYVPKFAVIHYLMAYAQQGMLTVDSLRRSMPFDTILVSQRVDMSQLAKQLGVSLNDLRTLNPQVKKNVVPAYFKGYTLRIPAEKKDFFVLNRSTILTSIAAARPSRQRGLFIHTSTFSTVHNGRKIIHTVSRGQVLSNIADQYQVSVKDVKRWNHLGGNFIKTGQRLVVWVVEKQAPKVTLAGNKIQTSSKTI